MTSTPEPGGELPYAAPFPEDAAAGSPAATGTGRGKPPRNVRFAAYVMLANALIALLSLVVTVATPLSEFQAALRNDPTINPADAVDLAGQLRNYYVTVSAVLFLANVGLSLALRRGFNWARVLTLLLTGMSLIVTLSGGGDTSGAAAAFTLVGVALDVAIIVLLATRPARLYFRRTREARTF